MKYSKLILRPRKVQQLFFIWTFQFEKTYQLSNKWINLNFKSIKLGTMKKKGRKKKEWKNKIFVNVKMTGISKALNQKRVFYCNFVQEKIKICQNSLKNEIRYLRNTWININNLLISSAIINTT